MGQHDDTQYLADCYEFRDKSLICNMTFYSQGALDPQRSQNLSIMLAKFGKKNISDVVKVDSIVVIIVVEFVFVGAFFEFVIPSML